LLAHTGLGGMGDGTGILRQVSRAHDRQRGFRVWLRPFVHDRSRGTRCCEVRLRILPHLLSIQRTRFRDATAACTTITSSTMRLLLTPFAALLVATPPAFTPRMSLIPQGSVMGKVVSTRHLMQNTPTSPAPARLHVSLASELPGIRELTRNVDDVRRLLELREGVAEAKAKAACEDHHAEESAQAEEEAKIDWRQAAHRGLDN